MKKFLVSVLLGLLLATQGGCITGTCGITPCEAAAWTWDKVTDIFGAVAGCIGCG